MNRKEINEILEAGAAQLDITPSMFKEATDHYNAVGNYLQNNSIETEIYAYGSTANGTVTRPYSESEEEFFDIDVAICAKGFNQDDRKPDDVRDPIETSLYGSDLYSDKIESSDECVTVKYVSDGINDGFRLDLNMCIEADSDLGSRASRCATYPLYADESIALAWRNPSRWQESNPRGLTAWFKDKNTRFAEITSTKQKARILRDYSKVYASIEEVPDALTHTPLQRAIQILKRSREVYYETSCWENQPTSCMLTVLLANISETVPSYGTILDILETFVRNSSEAKSIVTSGGTCFIGRSGSWALENPVFEGNLLDEWTDIDASRFFKWVAAFGKFLANLSGIQQKREAAAGQIFGKKIGGAVVPTVSAPALIASGLGDVDTYRPWGA